MRILHNLNLPTLTVLFNRITDCFLILSKAMERNLVFNRRMEECMEVLELMGILVLREKLVLDPKPPTVSVYTFK